MLDLPIVVFGTLALIVQSLSLFMIHYCLSELLSLLSVGLYAHLFVSDIPFACLEFMIIPFIAFLSFIGTILVCELLFARHADY